MLKQDNANITFRETLKLAERWCCIDSPTEDIFIEVYNRNMTFLFKFNLRFYETGYYIGPYTTQKLRPHESLYNETIVDTSIKEFCDNKVVHYWEIDHANCKIVLNDSLDKYETRRIRETIKKYEKNTSNLILE